MAERALFKNLWIEETLAFCNDNDLPLDFISTHHYCADASLEVGADIYDMEYRGQRAMVEDVKRTVQTVRSSAFPDAEVHYTEWNVSPCHEDRFGKDSEFNAVFVLQTLADLDGVVDVYSYWCISDIFEESGPGLYPFSGKYGLMNIHGIRKPSFHAFHWMNELYDEELATPERDLRVTRNGDDLRILLWRFQDPLTTDFNGADYIFEERATERELLLEGLDGRYQLVGHKVDRESGNSYRAWQTMGSPQYPGAEQLAILDEASHPVPCVNRIIDTHEGDIKLHAALSPGSIVFYDLKKLD